MSRVLIGGTGSGCGKTSVTCGLLRALRRRGLRPAACKCGPDYIDPMFHRDVLGTPSRNLDLYLCGEEAVRELLADSCARSDVAVVEGVMGFYDGLAGTDEASSHHLSRATGTPVVLVADCGGKALSLAAELAGYARFRENNIAGFLLNRCTERSYPMLKALVEEHTGLPVLGYLPRLPEAALESRHLGLVTAAEVGDLREKVDAIAARMERTVDLDGILAAARRAPALPAERREAPHVGRVRVAAARDAAFCFTYGDNLLLLERMGAEIVPFSPLEDRELPEDIHGMILSGGYPELYAPRLAENRSMREAVRAAVAGGLPTIAECGGFMLLCESVRTREGESYPMAGAVPVRVEMTGRLSRFGYVEMTARSDNLLCRRGERLRAHEFHYSEASDPGNAFRAEKAGGAGWDCVHATQTLYAGYPHLHFWGNAGAAERFLARCLKYKEK